METGRRGRVAVSSHDQQRPRSASQRPSAPAVPEKVGAAVIDTPGADVGPLTSPAPMRRATGAVEVGPGFPTDPRDGASGPTGLITRGGVRIDDEVMKGIGDNSDAIVRKGGSDGEMSGHDAPARRMMREAGDGQDQPSRIVAGGR